MQNCFKDAYSARKLVSEIQIMRKLTEQKSNCFTTLVYDLITPEIDPKTEDQIDYVFIVMDYEESDLRQILNEYDCLSFTAEHITIIMYNLLCSLNYLHSANIMHRDIKPANILIDYNCRAKLCDFGLARKRPIVNTHQEMEEYLSLHPTYMR